MQNENKTKLFAMRLSPLLIFSCVQIATVQAQPIVVIGNINSSITSLSQNDLKKIYLGKPYSLSSGAKVVPLDQPGSSSEYSDFYKQVLNWSTNQIGQYWSGLIFSGEATAPSSVDSDAAAIARVAEDPTAIAYISESAANALPQAVQVLYAVSPKMDSYATDAYAQNSVSPTQSVQSTQPIPVSYSALYQQQQQLQLEAQQLRLQQQQQLQQQRHWERQQQHQQLEQRKWEQQQLQQQLQQRAWELQLHKQEQAQHRKQEPAHPAHKQVPKHPTAKHPAAKSSDDALRSHAWSLSQIHIPKINSVVAPVTMPAQVPVQPTLPPTAVPAPSTTPPSADDVPLVLGG